MIDHLKELDMSYGLLEVGDIEKFEELATEADLDYLDKLISACIKWTFSGHDAILQKRLRRDEIKCLERVTYRLQKANK